MSELQQINELYNSLVEVRQLEAKAKADIEAFSASAKRLEGAIGELFNLYGLNELTMADGKKVTLKTNYYGTVSQERIAQVRQFLQDTDSLAILKPKKLKVDGEDIERLPADLRNKVQHEIHASTLKAFLKELDEKGSLTKEVRDLFAVHQINSVVLK